ncbi:nicotinamide riboside transporter PnuC [Sphingomonas sp. GlSt437]|uniref:nicotinamide riboside transporter PnuC n=1 Tax=Sphingomonas sp. GlSt437 TaxID=3389970 RepID=UPI003A8C4851
MTPLEAVAAVLVLVNVALVARRSLWNYPIGLAAVTLYAIIFFRSRLYSDALLQIFFFIVQLYGWWNWAASKGESGAVVVERLGARTRVGWAGGIVAATLGWGWLAHRFTDAAYPWWDASVAMMSIAAQILMSRRAIENWVLWIAVDIVAIGLYAAKDLWLTAAVYLVLLAISIWGLVDWQRAARRAASA